MLEVFAALMYGVGMVSIVCGAIGYMGRYL